MAGDFAKTISGFAWRYIAVVCAFALLTYGHGVLSDTRVFGFYTALCLFAVAIVFYQTSAFAVCKWDGGAINGDAIQLNRSRVHKRMGRLNDELATLEEEYKADVLRLQGKWL